MPPRRPYLNDYLPRKETSKRPQLAGTEMEYTTLESRIASFAPPTKRSKAGWPHKAPSPRDLAKAGFFYKATSSKDNVECFLCGRQLDGWEEDDDALAEHLKHGADCAWALLMSLEQDSDYDTANMEDPTSDHLTEARRNTFESIEWPHENKRGWTCKTEKMVEAGWHFAPTTDCDDYTSCVYCKLSLDGWEPKDNPFEEHYRRSPGCPFFHFAGATAPSKRPKAKKGRASRASKASRTSKASRLSTQSNTTMMSQLDESTGIIEIHGVDTTMEESTLDNSIVSVQSKTSTGTTRAKRKALVRAKGAAPKKARTTRGKKIQPELQPEPDNEPESQQTLEEVGLLDEQPKPKNTRTRKKKAPTPEPEVDGEAQFDQIEDEPAAIEEESESTTSRSRNQERELTPEPEPDMQSEAQSIHEDEEAAAVQEVEEHTPGAYPTIPDETPDRFETPTEEPKPELEPAEVPSPDLDGIQTGPPEKESTPIPAKQISPLKELSQRPRPTISPQVNEAQTKRGSSGRQQASQSSSKGKVLEPQQSRSPSQPSDAENLAPSRLPEDVRPPLSSPGAPPPEWKPIDVELVFQRGSDKDIDLFGGAVTGDLSDIEKDMTVQQWIGHVAGQAESRLSAEGERVVSIFEREGRRAMTALEGIQCV